MGEYEPKGRKDSASSGGAGPGPMCYPEDRGGGGWRQYERLDASEPGPSPGLATLTRSADDEEGVCGAAVKREAPRNLVDSGALRLKAVDRLHEIERALNDRIDAEAHWLSLNWTRFIGQTGSNPAFAYPHASYMSVVGRAAEQPSVGRAVGASLGNSTRSVSLGMGLEGVADAIGDSFGTTFSKSVARGLGKALPILFDLVWAVIDDYQMQRKVDRLLHERDVRQAHRTEERIDAFLSEATTQKLSERAVLDEIRASVDAMATREDFDRFDMWANGRLGALPPIRNTGDRSLFADMLAHWVLQHTGDVGAPNAETGVAEYGKALKYVEESSFTSAVLEPGNAALYLHQLKYALASHGLSPEPVERLVSRPQPGLYRLEGVKVVSPPAFAKAMKHRHRWSPDGTPRVPNYLAAAQRDEVVMTCDFQCDIVDGRPILERVEFVATCVGKSREAWDRGVTLVDRHAGAIPSGFDVVEWEYEQT